MKFGAVFSIVMATIIVGGIAGYAQEHPCTDTEAQKAESEAMGLRSWDDLYKSFRLYKQCDDGAIGEGYSESVARILVDHWNTLSRLEALGIKDTVFRRFVLKHIDGTITLDDIVKIKKNATTLCPKTLQKLCGDLKKQSELGQSSELKDAQDKILFDHAKLAVQERKFDVAHLTFQTIINTYLKSKYARRAIKVMRDPQIGGCSQAWSTPPCVDYSHGVPR